jgi:hypothetical protein
MQHFLQKKIILVLNLGFFVDDREAEVSFDDEKEIIIIKKNKAGLISCFLKLFSDMIHSK